MIIKAERAPPFFFPFFPLLPDEAFRDALPEVFPPLADGVFFGAVPPTEPALPLRERSPEERAVRLSVCPETDRFRLGSAEAAVFGPACRAAAEEAPFPAPTRALPAVTRTGSLSSRSLSACRVFSSILLCLSSRVSGDTAREEVSAEVCLAAASLRAISASILSLSALPSALDISANLRIS